MSFSRYPKYKDSGVKLLGQVPEQWQSKRFKRIFRERDERSANGDEMLLSVSAYTGVSPRTEIIDDGDYLSRADSLEGYKVCYKNDLVVNIMLAWNRGLAFTDYHGIVSPAYCVYSIVDGSDPTFLNYLVRSDEYTLYFKAHSSGVIDSRLRIYPESFGALFCALPPIAEQKLIADFLDGETSRIDSLVAEQHRLIELLKEKRHAFISHAVTKGLNPKASMKASGIDWLGEIASGWQERRLKAVSTFITSGPHGWSERIGEEGRLFVQSGDLNDRLEIDFAAAKRVKVEENAETTRTRMRDGDVLICITGAKTGNVAVCSSIPEPAYINQHLCLVRPNLEILPSFLGALLKSRVGQTHFELSQYGLKQGLSLDDVKGAPVVLPSIDEQEAILSLLRSETDKLDALTIEAHRAVQLLEERRSTLISAAVTGQIDVRYARTLDAA
jgi:type I restriction enzyme S subunit